MTEDIFLSKSLFMRGLQCSKQLWLQKYQPELQKETTPQLEALFASGTEVGAPARQLFPGGILVPYEGLTHAEQLARTQAALAAGASILYEAAFSYDGVFVKVDILHESPAGWELYEVKQSTKEKDVYLDDIAIQYYVLAGSRLALCRAVLLHINNGYIRSGPIEAQQLFTAVDMTD